MADEQPGGAPAPAPAPAPTPTNPVADLVPSQDDVEWGQANDQFANERGYKPGDPLKKPEEGKDGDKSKPTGNEPEGTPKPNEEKSTPDNGNKPDDPNAKPEPPKPDDAENEEESGAEEEVVDDPATREYRQHQRQISENEQAIKADIRKELFSDVQLEILDADGEPIKTIEDVQKHINPNTGKAFTEEEAGAWLLKKQQGINEKRENVDKQVDEIAQTLLDMQDWSRAVKAKYGAFIKANPDIWKPIWEEYQNTLTKDEKSQIITKAPVNLEKFADVALAPHIKLAEQVQAQNQQEQKNKQEQQRKQARQDRSDIYGGGKPEVTDKEDEEWNQAAKDLYGN